MHRRVIPAVALIALLLAPHAGAVIAGFDTNFPASITVPNGTSQIAFSNLPVTNATGASVAYSNSSTPTNVTGFAFNPNPGFVLPVVGDGAGTNYLILYVTPGTVTNNVTNTLILTVTNAPGANATSTNLNVIVTPPIPGPPHLQVRFYNSSTNPPDQVYILPASTTYSQAGFGNGFWWSNSNGSNNWTNWIATSNQWTVRLSDIGVSGTNSQGAPYYAINTTNFPNAAWYLSYGGGMVSSTNNARPSAGATNSTWFGYEWTPFELTLSGNPADKCDTTYINEFSIPMTVRALTNTPANATAGIFPSNSLAFYQICGWTNWTNPSAVGATLTNLVQQLTNTFPNAVVTNSSGKAVMVSGPSSAGIGTLVAPLFTNPPFISDAQNSFPTLGAYFQAVANAQTNGRYAKIKDFIGATGVTNSTIGTGNGSNPVFFFYYNFQLEVTTNNALRLTGSLAVSNQPGSTASFTTNATNLVMEIGADAGPNDNWASSAVYLAPTPANYVAVVNSNNLTNGAPAGLITNVLGYSPYASNGLAGANVSITGTNLLAALQVAFSGPGDTLVPSPRIVATNSTNISAVVPLGAVTGPIVVTTANGSGKSSSNFAVTGYSGAAQNPSIPAGGPSAPSITGFTPTNGVAASPVLTVSGPWFDIANATGTGPTNTTNTSLTTEYYNSSFGAKVMGRIIGDLAAGFALGFINSTNINPYYTTNSTNAAFGDSPSGAWWGGNQYPAANSNSASYSQVNVSPQFSQWGNLIHQSTAVTYNHPIYDRMQYYGGGIATNPFQIQPSSATNNNPDVWVVEVEFFNGMSSVGSNAPSSVLTYSNWLTNYPSLANTNQSADPDSDSFTNATEYAFDGNPTVGSPALLTAAGSGTNSVFRFTGLQGASANYTVQTTTNLSSGPWTNAGVTVTNAADQSGLLIPASYERREFTVPAAGSNSFYRVLFTNAP